MMGNKLIKVDKKSILLSSSDLREAGLKVTIPRVKILHILQHSDGHHMSVDAVYKRLIDEGDEISLATVYRVLTQFEAAGLVTRHNFDHTSVFELNRGEHHDHLVCQRCDKVVEFYDEVIERKQEAIAKKAGFTITSHNHIIYGICPDCA